MANFPQHPVASQSGQPVGPLHTTPEGCLVHFRGAFEAPSPLTENSPKGSHAPRSEADPSPRRVHTRCWGHIKRVAIRFEQSWVGDLVGALCLFASGYLALVAAWVFG